LVTIASLLFGSAASQKADAKKCIALAMSGGGVKGAYEAGALYGMVHEAADKTQFEYDVVTGVSAGAINTAGVSLFKKGDEVNMVNILSERW
jgi:predicted acylesterase/phospholipase RssA